MGHRSLARGADSIVEAVAPFAVDVNSGVESAPGVKDAAKLKTLYRNLSGCE